MSMAEIKDRIMEMGLEERLELAALISQLNRSENPGYQTKIDDRMSQMDRGAKVSQQEIERQHEELTKAGR